VAKSSGGQPGNNNASGARRARKALELALDRIDNDRPVASGMTKLVKIWQTQIEKAIEGDNQSAQMIADRLDGRPGQAIQVTGEDGGPISVERIERTIVDTKA